MKEQLHTVKEKIINLVDFFHPPFRNVLDLQTFRYAACGGANTLFDILLFAFAHNYILRNDILQIGNIAISPHIAAFLLTFPISFITGFLLSRYVVFPESTQTKKRIQLGRYLVVVFVCIILNYIFLKLFVDVFGWWPLPAKLATTCIVVLFSYFSQKHFTFKKAGA